jgi:TonB-dependent SusC/RagA subfamily outer membrane receptor
MNIKTFSLFALIVAIYSINSFAQDTSAIKSLTQKIESYSNKFPEEKTYLQLDKPYYAIGDDIWFKAYVINAKAQTPSAYSNILYVDLINERDSVKKQLRMPMESGLTWGNFTLSDSLAEGNYRIRAYTNYMRNAGPDFFFDKTIKIGNSWINKVYVSANTALKNSRTLPTATTTVQFSDENGKPYSSCQVNFEVNIDSKKINSVKTVTNTNGIATFSYSNGTSNPFKTGYIKATITLPNQQKIIKNIPIKSLSNNVDVQFFPEGGNFVEGLPIKVGIKALNANGLGEAINGNLLDENNNEILNFATSDLGMGNLTMTYLPGKTYKAKITFKSGETKTIDFPKAIKSGYAINVNNLDSTKISIKVFLSDDLIDKGDLYLVAQHNGAVYFSGRLNTSKQVITVNAPKKDIPSGIVQITLLNGQFMPLAERIVFVNSNNDKIDININGAQPTYGVKTKSGFNISATHKGKPIMGSFSVAVTNQAAVKPDIDNESNIYTQLLLKSDIRGYIEKPNRYFESNDLQSKIDLDNLLLTQGWRKINWQNMVNNTEPKLPFKRETGLSVSGKITKSGKPVVHGKLTLLSTTGGMFMLYTLSDEQGHFNFENLAFTDSVKFIVQARTGKDNKNVTIDLDMITPQAVTYNKNTADVEVNVNQSLTDYLNQSKLFFDEQLKKGFLTKDILLDEVKIVTHKNPAPNSSNLNGAGNADAVFTAKDLENAISLSQFLQGRVAGIIIREGEAFSMRNMAGNGNAMSIVVDGITMQDFSLDNLIIRDIESIEILKPGASTIIYGAQGSGGVIVITTKRGGGISYHRDSPGIITYTPKGYPIAKEFYSPKYESPEDGTTDLRSTVYWNPQIITDKEGKTTIEYFNASQPGTYRMVIEGLDIDGKLGRRVLTYEVK